MTILSLYIYAFVCLSEDFQKPILNGCKKYENIKWLQDILISVLKNVPENTAFR